MTRSTVWMASAVLALSVLASPAFAQTSSGASDGFAPGPLNTLVVGGVQEISGVMWVTLQWNEPYNNTTAIDGSGTPVGTTLATLRKTFFSTNGPFNASGDFGGANGATICPGEAGISPPAGGTRTLAFPVPAGGMTYYFGQQYSDGPNFSYTVGVNARSVFVPAPTSGGGGGSDGGGGGGGGGCVASPVSWFSTFASTALSKVSEGASLAVLAGCLVLVGIALRRPTV